MNNPTAQADFVAALAALIPKTMMPILISDAGFCSDWFRAVAAQGWDYIGRIRNNVKARKPEQDTWPCMLN
ncbi:MAG: hypothetical protein LBE62_13850 [Azonexus sp.]|nr:hypothetical protein [Azonexus sp.]